METRRFARSKNVVLFGVCGGVADYTGINVTLVRVLWALLALTSWMGWLAVIGYIALMFVMRPPEGTPESERWSFRGGFNSRNLAIAAAVALICWGGYILVKEFLLRDIDKFLFPAGLILGGVLLMTFAFGGKRSK